MSTTPHGTAVRGVVAGLLLLAAAIAPSISQAGDEASMPNALTAMPAGYHLQFFDDCGVEGRQPHVRALDVHTFTTAEVKADEKARTVAWGWREVKAIYEGLDPRLHYVLAITYANEAFNNRVQSLWAGNVEIQGPHPLPRGGVERLLLRVPSKAIVGGKLELEFRLEAQVNVVVSEIELWADAPERKVLHLDPMTALLSDLGGQVTDTAWNPVAGAKVELEQGAGGQVLATTTSDSEGKFSFARKAFEGKTQAGVEVVAQHDGLTTKRFVAAHDLSYQPLTYRPMPDYEPGVKTPQRLLDGEWKLDPSPEADVLKMPFDAANWKPFHVPGQFVEEGYKIDVDKPVALATEFEVPKDWAGRRVILRLDAIHGGARYFLNGRPVGESQNLFTPVELDVTDAARPGRKNRLDIELTVNTLSERMSHASGYAFHSLGGVLRSVHLFALPRTYMRQLRIVGDLTSNYRDGLLDVKTRIANQGHARLEVRLLDPDGNRVNLADAHTGPSGFTARIPHVIPWNAEKPALYLLVVELKDGPRLLERIERNVGFRKIEVRDGQVLVNGVRVKLAGECHHEIDPVTGRADTMRHAEEDVRLFKEANLNFLRTSHYPPTRELLDAADRLGMYVEVEAPFCWVGDDNDQNHLRTVLNPTSAMVDYHGNHPSVIEWSLANESQFNWLFEQSAKMVKALDPTRLTTFNNPDPKRLCDIANVHYPAMPFDNLLPGDPRPIELGEWDFPVCHEQTDVRIDPGLRELWGAGDAEPDSVWGRKCAAVYAEPYPKPGEPPGAWTNIVHSKRVDGACIWAGIDDAFYLPDGTHVGYAWHHGFWGLIDVWRRPKPEWWLTKLIFSPVWFPSRHFDFSEGQSTLVVPVENRYSFTNLSELDFAWKLRGYRGHVTADVPPGKTGELRIPLPEAAREGDQVIVRVTDRHGELVNVAGLRLGKRPAHLPPAPTAGPPKWSDDGKTITIEGDGFALVLDKSKGQLLPRDPRYKAAITEFPALHVTRYDFGDLMQAPPYAVLPDEATRVVDGVEVKPAGNALEISVRDHYKDFAGVVHWTIDRKGLGRVVTDYTYTGETLCAREVGMRCLLRPGCDTLAWKRWSEWAVYPKDSISRTEGVARAHRDPSLGVASDRVAPKWPWSLDETALGTADFRGVKLNIYHASLTSSRGDGLRVFANADRHVRACLDPHGVWLHVLTDCHIAPVVIHRGDHIGAAFTIELLSPKQ